MKAAIETPPAPSQMTPEQYEQTESRLREKVSSIMATQKLAWEDALYKARWEESQEDVQREHH
jgi:hypothetical protein